jgi:hypothetical protein
MLLVAAIVAHDVTDLRGTAVSRKDRAKAKGADMGKPVGIVHQAKITRIGEPIPVVKDLDNPVAVKERANNPAVLLGRIIVMIDLEGVTVDNRDAAVEVGTVIRAAIDQPRAWL